MAGCKNCDQKFQGRCDVCSLVDNDNTFKEVVYCEECEAYICKKCQSNWIKRAVAYFIEKLRIKNKPEQPVVITTPIGNTYVVNDFKNEETQEEFLKRKEYELKVELSGSTPYEETV